MSKVESIHSDTRPHSKALHDGILELLEEFAVNKMTPYEVLGVLDFAAKDFYEANSGEDCD